MTAALLPYLLVLPALGYQLITLHAVRSFFARELPATDNLPPVTILKPLKGADAGLYDNLASFCRQHYPQYQLVCAVALPDDPAVAVVRRLQAAFPATDITLVVDGTVHGTNRKVSNLLNAWSSARHNIIIITDSDIRVEPDYLRRLAPFFSDPAVGLVTSLYRSSRVDSVAAAVEALGISVEMVPNVIVAAKLEGLSFALGASMACRRAAIEAIGGLAVLADYLADDYQLGNRIAKAGWRIELSAHFVESVIERASLATILSRQLRWCRTMRVSRPGGYFASVVKDPLLAVILVGAVAGVSTAALGAVLVLYGVRAVVATLLSRAFVRDKLLPRYLWLLPVRDVITFAAWLLAFTGNRVKWRGDTFRILPDGKMVRSG
jgi:ceramide glucosyltransferase